MQATDNRILIRALQGLILSLGSPLGWAAIQLLSGVDLTQDLTDNTGVYLYMGVGTAIVFVSFGIYVGHKEGLLSLMTLVDPLTSLYNNRYFQERLQETYAHARRYEEPMSLILLDLDHFKRVNDKYGHLAGDQVLKGVGQALKNSCRGGETISRVGGEEICVILTNCSQQQAVQAAERFRDEISKVVVPGENDEKISVTASAGVASTETLSLNARELYAAADKAMYHAKQTGRDKICVFAEQA